MLTGNKLTPNSDDVRRMMMERLLHVLTRVGLRPALANQVSTEP